MVRLDERTARAFAQLKNPALQPILQFWRAQRQDTLEQLTQATTDTQVYRLQGEAAALKQMIEFAEKAESLIAKLKQ
jgi:hypothetical protein